MGHQRPVCNTEAITIDNGAFVAIFGNESPVARQTILGITLKFTTQTSSFQFCG